MKGVNLIEGERFWKVSSHCFLHCVPDCDIITALFNYSSSLWPKKIRVIMEQALSYISFLKLSVELFSTVSYLSF